MVARQLRTTTLETESVYDPRTTALLLRIPEDSRSGAILDSAKKSIEDGDQRPVVDILQEVVEEKGW
jgi:hypothetical protein